MDSANVVDLEPVVKDWAWTEYQKSSKDAKKVSYKDVQFKVKWDDTEFFPSQIEYLNPKRGDDMKSQVVFKSIYENRTKEVQENSFTTERCTTSVCTTTLIEGFTKGMHVELKLALPEDIMEVTTGFGREVTMEKGTEETHEETLTWTANSTVRVQPNHRTTASLVVSEEEFYGDFKMSVRISGHMLVVLTNLRDNNSFLSSIEGNIVTILNSADLKGFVKEGKFIVCNVSGKSRFRYGIEQHITISEEPLCDENTQIATDACS